MARKDQVQAEDGVLSCASIVAVLVLAEPGRHASTAQGERRAAAADAKDKRRVLFMQFSRSLRNEKGSHPTCHSAAPMGARCLPWSIVDYVVYHYVYVT